MAQDLDRSAYLGAFRAEMEEHLQVLSRELLLLESHPDDLTPVGEVFRRTHTVKGSARMMGFGEVADLAHSLEDVLDDLRSERLRPNPPLLDAMLTAADLLRELIQSAPEDSHGRQDVQAVIRWLADLRGAREQSTVEVRPQEPSSQPVTPQRSETGSRDTVRVDVRRIDAILNLAGELMVLDAAQRQWMADISQLAELLEGGRAGGRAGGLNDEDDRIAVLTESVSRSNKRYRRMALQQVGLVRELHYQISTLRMLPVGAIFSVIPRAARDLAREERKEVEVLVEGEETEIDREVLERVRDPVLHLVFNAVVHGIETPAVRMAAGKPAAGRVRVAAYSRGEQAIVEVEDDGAGIGFRAVREAAVRKGFLAQAEAEKLEESECVRLLFLPGLTTSTVVSGRSGRGVGLDIVKAEIDALKGHVWVETRPGRGTKVTLELPITLAFTHVLLVEVGPSTYGFACSSIQGIAEVSADRIQSLQGRACAELDGRTVPLYWMDQLLGMEQRRPRRGSRWPVLLVGSMERPVAFVVDRVIGDENVIVKPLGSLLRRVPEVSGGIVLGDGRVALVLSASALADTARGVPSFDVGPTHGPRRPVRRVLVVDDAATTRELERAILETAGYQVETAVDGQDALEKLRSRQFELVVADVEMPRMDGLQLAAAVRGDPLLNRLPIVMVSSRESDEDRRRGMQVGVQAYVGKGSFDHMTLLDTIESLIG